MRDPTQAEVDAYVIRRTKSGRGPGSDNPQLDRLANILKLFGPENLAIDNEAGKLADLYITSRGNMTIKNEKIQRFNDKLHGFALRWEHTVSDAREVLEMLVPRTEDEFVERYALLQLCDMISRALNDYKQMTTDLHNRSI